MTYQEQEYINSLTRTNRAKVEKQELLQHIVRTVVLTGLCALAFWAGCQVGVLL